MAESEAPSPRAAATRTGHVDGEGAAVELPAVEGFDCGVSAFHLDETEAAGAAGIAVGDDADALDRAMLAEEVANLVLGRTEGEVPHVDLLHSAVAFLLGAPHSLNRAHVVWLWIPNTGTQ